MNENGNSCVINLLLLNSADKRKREKMMRSANRRYSYSQSSSSSTSSSESISSETTSSGVRSLKREIEKNSTPRELLLRHQRISLLPVSQELETVDENEESSVKSIFQKEKSVDASKPMAHQEKISRVVSAAINKMEGRQNFAHENNSFSRSEPVDNTPLSDKSELDFNVRYEPMKSPGLIHAVNKNFKSSNVGAHSQGTVKKSPIYPHEVVVKKIPTQKKADEHVHPTLKKSAATSDKKLYDGKESASVPTYRYGAFERDREFYEKQRRFELKDKSSIMKIPAKRDKETKFSLAGSLKNSPFSPELPSDLYEQYAKAYGIELMKKYTKIIPINSVFEQKNNRP